MDVESRRSMVMLPKGILFDLDDTIIAYTPVVEPTWRRICQEYARKSGFLEADILYRSIREASDWFWSDRERHRIGRNNLHAARRDILEIAFHKMDIPHRRLAREIADTFSEEREEAVFLFEGAKETLEYFRSRNVSLALITNGEAGKQRNKINRFRLEEHFMTILIEGEIGFGKPEEAVYQRALNELGLRPEEVWSVGDNLEWDILGPQKMGVFGIWNDFSGKGLPDNSKIVPDRIVHRISELIPISDS